MNYIPGFSNYLRTSVPRYAVGGRVRFDEPMMYDEPMVYDTGNYSEPYQYTPPLEQYAPVEQPMMYDMGNYGALPYDTGGGMLLPAAEPQYEPAVEPMTQEAAPAEVPFDPSTLDFSGLDLSGLDSLYGMNFGSNFGGGAMGGIYPDDPNTEFIAAPISNKGNATSQTGGNAFEVRADQPVRLVDHRTNQIVFEGTGFDAARKATELGQGLTDQFGRKANYSIQTADPTGNYSTVAYEKKNKSTLGTIADVAGTVAPLALGFVPGFGQLSLLAKMGAAAGAGGLGAALKGDDILKGALLGGATAGVVSGTGLDKALGSALGGLSKGAAQGVTQGAAQAGGQAAGQAAGDIVVTGLSKGLQAAGGALGQAALSQAGKAGLSEITGYKTPAEQFAQQPPPDALQPPVDMYAGIDPIDVLATRAAAPNYGGALANAFAPIATEFLPKSVLPEALPSEPTTVSEPTPVDDTIVVSADRLASGSGSPFAASFPVPVSAMLSGALTAAQPEPVEQPKTAEDIEAAKNPIVVTGAGLETLNPEELLAALGGAGALAAATAGGGSAASNVVNGIDQATGDIVVEAPQSVSAPPPIAGIETAFPTITQGALTAAQTAGTPPEGKLTAKDIADYLRLASLGVSTVGGLLGGDKGGGSRGTIPAGMGGLSSLFSKQLPASTLQGGVGGGALPASTLASQGFNSPQDYYRYGYGPEQSFFSYATQGAPNTSRAYTGYEGSTAEDAFAPQPMRVATPPVALPQPITTPIPNNPAGPSMYAPEVDDMRFARGGFAVEGAGDGRDDKIPALLSDGEYVIDAETVALLGNGSNKAGAKLLDSFRVKVRKQKGKKLARGKFSDNAKRPEHYLAGGKA